MSNVTLDQKHMSNSTSQSSPRQTVTWKSQTCTSESSPGMSNCYSEQGHVKLDFAASQSFPWQTVTWKCGTFTSQSSLCQLLFWTKRPCQTPLRKALHGTLLLVKSHLYFAKLPMAYCYVEKANLYVAKLSMSICYLEQGPVRLHFAKLPRAYCYVDKLYLYFRKLPCSVKLLLGSRTCQT